MAALNFPITPTLNDIFNAPSGVQYRWDGEKWVSQAAQALLTGTRTVLMNARSINPALTDGCSDITRVEIGGETYQFRTFDHATAQSGYVDLPVPKSVNLTGIIGVRNIEWSYGGAPAAHGVVWEARALILGDGDLQTIAYGSPQQIVDTGGAADTVFITGDTPGIAAGGIWTREFSALRLKLTRNVIDGGNTLTVPARLHSFEVLWFYDLSNDE